MAKKKKRTGLMFKIDWMPRPKLISPCETHWGKRVVYFNLFVKLEAHAEFKQALDCFPRMKIEFGIEPRQSGPWLSLNYFGTERWRVGMKGY